MHAVRLSLSQSIRFPHSTKWVSGRTRPVGWTKVILLRILAREQSNQLCRFVQAEFLPHCAIGVGIGTKFLQVIPVGNDDCFLPVLTEVLVEVPGVL